MGSLAVPTLTITLLQFPTPEIPAGVFIILHLHLISTLFPACHTPPAGSGATADMLREQRSPPVLLGGKLEAMPAVSRPEPDTNLLDVTAILINSAVNYISFPLFSSLLSINAMYKNSTELIRFALWHLCSG